jgi:ABC-2 type transport system ATP-binding protein
MADLRSELRPRLVVRTPDPQQAEKTLTSLGLTDVRRQDDVVEGDPGELPIDKLAAALVAADVRIHAFGLQHPSLEDAFVALTGEGFDVAE